MIEVHTLVGAYALDAVDDVERAAVERHLRGCVACAAEAAELRATAARLVDAAAVAPPPRLREAVTARIRRTRQEAPRPGRPLPLPGAGPRRWRAVTAAPARAGA